MHPWSMSISLIWIYNWKKKVFITSLIPGCFSSQSINTQVILIPFCSFCNSSEFLEDSPVHLLVNSGWFGLWLAKQCMFPVIFLYCCSLCIKPAVTPVCVPVSTCLHCSSHSSMTGGDSLCIAHPELR